MVKVLPSRLTSIFLPLLIWTVSPAFTALAVSLSLCSFQPWLKLAMSPVFWLTWLLTWFRFWLVWNNCEPFTASLDVAFNAPAATLVMVWLPALMPSTPTLTALAVLPFLEKVKASEPYCTLLPVLLLLTFRPLDVNTLLLPAVSLRLTLLSVMSLVVFTVMVLFLRSTSMLVPLLIATVWPAFTAVTASPSLCNFQPCSKVFTEVCKLLTLPPTAVMLLFNSPNLSVTA